MRFAEIITEARSYFGGFSSQPGRDEVQRYMRGWCPYFALALHDVYGWQIVTTGGHFAAQTASGAFVDVRGVMTPEEFRDGIGEAPEPMSRDELMGDLESGVFKCGFFEEGQLSRAKRLVKKLNPQTLDEDSQPVTAAAVADAADAATDGTIAVIETDFDRSTNMVHVTWVGRGAEQGEASQAFSRFLEWCDERHLGVELTALDGALGLIKYYMRFGFVVHGVKPALMPKWLADYEIEYDARLADDEDDFGDDDGIHMVRAPR